MNELINKEEKWKLLYEHIAKMNYGDTLLHSDIENIILESHESKKYFSIISKAKKKLLEISKCIKSITGQGYTIVTPDEYTDLSLKHIKSGSKQIKKGYEVLQYAPKEKMSEEGLQRYRHVSDRAMSLNAMITGSCTELKLLNKKSKLLITNN